MFETDYVLVDNLLVDIDEVCTDEMIDNLIFKLEILLRERQYNVSKNNE